MKKNLGAVFVLAAAVLLASCGGTTDSSSSGNASSSEVSSSSSESSSSSSNSESIPEPVEDVTGSGTQADPYLVNSLAGLEAIRDDIQNVETATYVELMADLDLSGQQWTPLGNFEAAANVVFDGNGHLVKGLSITAALEEGEDLALGFFGAATGTVMNLTVEGDIALNYANEEHFTQLVGQINTLLSQFGPALGITNSISIPALNTGTFSSELPLPDNWNVGLTYRPTKDWTISGEVQFVGWGAYDQLAIHFSPSSLSGYDMAADKKYENTRIYRVGAQYAATDRLDIRFGAYFDESPVKDDYLNPETPSMDKLGITAGLSFRPLDRLSVDFAFSYVTGFGRDGSYTDEYMLMKTIPNVPDQYRVRTFGGHYSAYALMPAIGLSYKF